MAYSYKSKWQGEEIDDAVGKIANVDATIDEKIADCVSDVTYADYTITVTKNNGTSENLLIPNNGDTDVFVVPLTNEGQTYSYNFTPVKHTFDTVWQAAVVDNKAVFFSTNTGMTCPLIDTFTTSSGNRVMNAISGAGVSTSATDPRVGNNYLQWSEARSVITNYNGKLGKATTTTGGLMTAADKIAIDSIDSIDFTKVQQLYYNYAGTTTSFTLNAAIPSNSIVVVIAKRTPLYNVYTESMTSSALSNSIIVESRPTSAGEESYYRKCSWNDTSFTVGNQYCQSGEASYIEHAVIVAVYAILPYTT